MTVSHPPSNRTSINTYIVSNSSTVDYFRVADGLLYTAMNMDDGVKATMNNESEDGWSDGDATMFEEYHESQGTLPRDTRPTAPDADNVRAFIAL